MATDFQGDHLTHQGDRDGRPCILCI